MKPFKTTLDSTTQSREYKKSGKKNERKKAHSHGPQQTNAKHHKVIAV